MIIILLGISEKLTAQAWTPIENEAALHALFDDTEQSSQLTNNSVARAIFNRDGTGTLYAWGETYARKWKVENGMVALLISEQWKYWTIEQQSSEPNTYRATPQDGGVPVIFTVVKDNTLVSEKSGNSDEGQAVKPSADELAKALANPNTPMAKITTKLQYRTFEGTLPNANSQSSTTLLLQPSFPFPLNNGDLVFFRPAIPILIGQPTINESGNFESKTGLGDIAFDLAYGKTNKKTGLITALGMIVTIPTAAPNDLGGKNLNLGPEVLVGLLSSKYVIGAFPNHQWKVAGNGAATNLTTVQLFANLLPGKAWVVGTAPIMNYDWNAEQWTIPLNLTLGKTYVLGGRPWSFSMEANYFVDKAASFGQQWFIGFSVSPVVENVMAKWFQ